MQRRSTAAIALILLTAWQTLSNAQSTKTSDEGEQAPPPATKPAEADADFAIQGEYSGQIELPDSNLKYGVQVIAMGNGKFQAVTYRGGLPGDGWNGVDRDTTDGKTEDGVTKFVGDHVTGILERETLMVRTSDGKALGKLTRVHRKSPTLGAKPPEDAVVLFDGKSAEHFEGGRMTDDGLLMQGLTSHRQFQDCTLHMEFQLSYMPHARGQGRSNSGIYLQGRYEVQILDSFGLEGLNNECGGIYEIRDPDLNMCFPPLSWQTYDIDYTAARYDSQGEKTSNAKITVRHNGVLIHENVEMPRTTRAAPVKESPEPGPIYIQDHRNPVRFRNIWLVERDGGPDDSSSDVADSFPQELGGHPLVFADAFSDGNADDWDPVNADAFRMAQQGDNHVYNQFKNIPGHTPVRSPFNRSMIKDVTVSDFVFDVHLQSTARDYPHRSLCLFFGYQDPAHLYYVHFGQRTDDHANNIFIVNDAPRTKISTKTTPGTNWDNEWHHARIVRDVSSGSIEIFFDDMETPVMTANDTTFQWGQVGVGSFDDTGNFDDIALYGTKVDPPKYESLFDGETLAGWHTNPEKIGHGTGGLWRVEDGAIVGEQDPPGSGNGGILLTDETFGDFELLIDMKPDWGICSGLFLRSTQQGKCFQMLVDYHDNGNVGHIYGEGTGAFTNRPFDIMGVYDDEKNLTGLTTQPPKRDTTASGYSITGDDWVHVWKVNDWNTAKVRVVGSPPKITTWINSLKVSEFDAAEFEDPKYDRDKVSELLGSEGRIAVQVHGGTRAWPKGAVCRWRNIRIRRLSE